MTKFLLVMLCVLLSSQRLQAQTYDLLGYTETRQPVYQFYGVQTFVGIDGRVQYRNQDLGIVTDNLDIAMRWSQRATELASRAAEHGRQRMGRQESRLLRGGHAGPELLARQQMATDPQAMARMYAAQQALRQEPPPMYSQPNPTGTPFDDIPTELPVASETIDGSQFAALGLPANPQQKAQPDGHEPWAGPASHTAPFLSNQVPAARVGQSSLDSVELFAPLVVISVLFLVFIVVLLVEASQPVSPSSGVNESANAPVPKSRCPACGISVFSDATVCGRCGCTLQPLAAEAPSAAVHAGSGAQENADQRTTSGMAIAGFCLGIASVFFYWIGIVPLLGLVFSIMALANYQPELHKNRWMAITGLVLSALYMLMCLFAYAHVT